MNNINKVVKQILINISIMVISILVIYVAQSIQKKSYLSWKDGLNADLLFVMLSSLGTVVGWRVVEQIKCNFGHNLLLIIVGGVFCFEYACALIMNNNEVVKMCVFFSIVPFLYFYITEQVKLIHYASKNKIKGKRDSLRYR